MFESFSISRNLKLKYYKHLAILRKKVKKEGQCYVCLEYSTECVELQCKHYVHENCIKKQIENLCHPGTLILYRQAQCGLCGSWLKYKSLEREYQKVIQNVKKIYQVKKSDDIYRCYVCTELFITEKKRCVELTKNDPKNTVCKQCKYVCKQHGSTFIVYKCFFCCSEATWKCSRYHFCDYCHLRQEAMTCVGMSGGCRVKHPPNGTETFVLGCGLCYQNIQ